MTQPEVLKFILPHHMKPDRGLDDINGATKTTTGYDYTSVLTQNIDEWKIISQYGIGG